MVDEVDNVDNPKREWIHGFLPAFEYDARTLLRMLRGFLHGSAILVPQLSWRLGPEL